VLVLPVPGDLSGERRTVTVVAWGDELRAITFDFGNTLVAVDRAALRRVVEVTASAVVERLGPFDVGQFMAVWAEERERQFREEVPRFREVDLAERFARVLARLRGLEPPGPDDRWDQAVAAGMSTLAEIDWAVETYSRAFVDALPPPPIVEPLLGRLAGRYRLAILSNWPLAATIDRYAEAAGWTAHLDAIVVSQRVGTIKPHPAMSATTGRPTSSVPPRPGGAPRMSTAAHRTRRCRRASVIDRSNRTWR
jgi:FMN phosphatase YigB (HAD superfamily)